MTNKEYMNPLKKLVLATKEGEIVFASLIGIRERFWLVFYMKFLRYICEGKYLFAEINFKGCRLTRLDKKYPFWDRSEFSGPNFDWRLKDLEVF